MDLNEWFDKGLMPTEYMDRLTERKEGFYKIYNHFSAAMDEETIQQIKQQKLRVIAIAEVWCGHCMLCTPILLRLAEKTEMPVKILPRDENLELMDQYQTNNKRIIPIFVFIDKDGKEVATWGPMSETTKEFVDERKKNLPPKDAENYQEKFKEFTTQVSNEFATDEKVWKGTFDSILEALI